MINILFNRNSETTLPHTQADSDTAKKTSWCSWAVGALVGTACTIASTVGQVAAGTWACFGEHEHHLAEESDAGLASLAERVTLGEFLPSEKPLEEAKADGIFVPTDAMPAEQSCATQTDSPSLPALLVSASKTSQAKEKASIGTQAGASESLAEVGEKQFKREVKRPPPSLLRRIATAVSGIFSTIKNFFTETPHSKPVAEPQKNSSFGFNLNVTPEPFGVRRQFGLTPSPAEKSTRRPGFTFT